MAPPAERSDHARLSSEASTAWAGYRAVGSPGGDSTLCVAAEVSAPCARAGNRPFGLLLCGGGARVSSQRGRTPAGYAVRRFDLAGTERPVGGGWSAVAPTVAEAMTRSIHGSPRLLKRSARRLRARTFGVSLGSGPFAACSGVQTPHRLGDLAQVGRDDASKSGRRR